MVRNFRLVSMAAITIALAWPAGAFAQNTAPGAAETGGSAQPQVMQPDEGGVNWKGVGVGAGTVAGNILYVPAKLAYGILGGIAGGAGYVLTGGNKQVSDTIWRSSLGGDYVLTPDMVTGKERVHFSGPTDTAVPPPADSSSESTGATSTAMTTNSAPAGPSTASSSLSSASTPPANGSMTTQPIDSGAGPVKQGGYHAGAFTSGSNSNMSRSTSTATGGRAMPAHRSSPPSDSSIE
jgi:hypothetical protein